MTTTEEKNKEVLRQVTERNKIADYAMQILGCDERRADAFQKVAGDFLKWDGTLQFKTASGAYVAADDPQAKGFFEREFDFLVPKQASGGDNKAAAEVPADVLESALGGNLTAVGKVLRIRGDATMAETQKFLAGERAKGGDGDGDRNRDKGGRFVSDKGNNPFTAANWNLTEQMRVHRSDPELAKRLANKAGVTVGAARPAKVAS